MNNNDKLLEQILASDMTLMEKAIAKEFIFRNEELAEDDKSSLKLNYEKVKNLTDRFMNDNYIWGEINYFINENLEELEIAEEEKRIFEDKDFFIKKLIQDYKIDQNPMLVQIINNILDYANKFDSKEKIEFVQDLLPVIPYSSIDNDYLSDNVEDDEEER